MTDSGSDSEIDPLDAAIFSNYEAAEPTEAATASARVNRRNSNRDFVDTDDESEEPEPSDAGEEDSVESDESVVQPPVQPLLTGASLLPTAEDRKRSRGLKLARKKRSKDILGKILGKQDTFLKSIPNRPIRMPAYVPLPHGCSRSVYIKGRWVKRIRFEVDVEACT